MTNARFASCLALFTLLVTGHSLADVAADMQAESSGGDVGSQMSTEGGGEAKAGGGTAARGGDGGGQRISGDGFASVDGPTGAGLSLDPGQRGRFWGELGLHTQDRV